MILPDLLDEIPERVEIQRMFGFESRTEDPMFRIVVKDEVFGYLDTEHTDLLKKELIDRAVQFEQIEPVDVPVEEVSEILSISDRCYSGFPCRHVVELKAGNDPSGRVYRTVYDGLQIRFLCSHLGFRLPEHLDF